MILLPLLTLLTPDDGPKLETRKAQPYVAIRATVAMKDLSATLPKLWGELDGWLKDKGVKRTGPTLIRYLKVDMEKGLLIDVGWPVAKVMKAQGRVVSSEIPAGRYVSLTHRGDFSGLVAANGRLQDWAIARNLKWKMKGDVWSGRVESYPVDPADTPDPAKWVTEIYYRVEGK